MHILHSKLWLLLHFASHKFAIKLDGKVWHHVKILNYPTSQSSKNKKETPLYHYKLYH